MKFITVFKTVYKNIFIAGILLFCLCSASAQVLYTPADAGSKVHFTIKNFGIKTAGEFTGLQGKIYFDPAHINAASFDVSVAASSINTHNGSRDNHLKKEEYFDVAKYPTLHFKSTKITLPAKEGRYLVAGNLTIKGITKAVAFYFTAAAKEGGYFFEGAFEINRRDFKVGGGSLVLQDNLKINLTVMAKK